MYIKKSGKLFAQAAESLRRHPQHGGNILQRDLVEQGGLRLHEPLKALLGRFVQMAEDAVFEHGETFCNKQFIHLVPGRYSFTERPVIFPADAPEPAIGEGLDIPSGRRVKEKTG